MEFKTMSTDPSKNKPLDIPVFDLQENPYVDFVITKAKMGFALIDQVDEEESFYTIKANDVERMVKYTSDSLVAAMNTALERHEVGGQIEVIIIFKDRKVEEKEAPKEPPPPLELDYYAIAEIINRVNTGRYSPAAKVGLRGGGSKYISPDMIARIFGDEDEIASIQRKVKITTKGAQSDYSRNRPPIPGKKQQQQGKEFHDDTKNKGKEDENDGGGRGGRKEVE
jgi:hypothetical protein